jgi:transcriptional regulator with XRE-family HTH domain
MRDKAEALGRFGRNLRLARRRARLSQEALARRAGISRSYVGRLEVGGSECRFLTAMRLADGLGISVDDFLNGVVRTPDPDKATLQDGSA